MRYSILLGFLFTTLNAFSQLAAPSSPQSVFLGKGWQMQHFPKAGAGGETISTKTYKPDGWQPAIVPGTVLTSLVANKVYPDPYFGDANKRLLHKIPDMADAGREFYHYWFRNSFRVPATLTGKRLWLRLHGINYRAEIWLNGQKLGDMAGMFNTQAFDITNIAVRNKENVLAVNITPVDVPGQSGLKKERRNGAPGENQNGGDGMIGKNVTMLMSAGWDFTFADGIRDRNTGIWREVELYTTGDVLVEHPFVVSDLPLPDTTSSRETISVEVANASDKMQEGLLQATIPENGITIQQKVSLAPKERKTLVFTPETHPQLAFRSPKLWWPINKGHQFLYHLNCSFIQNKAVSHTSTSTFGIREISSDRKTPDSSRRFLVNGHPVFIRGTNWIPEAMLQNSRKRTNAELVYTRQSGLNFIRFWAGGITESDYFFQRCDELGLMIWAEFWITGDTQFPVDKPLYLSNIENTVKRIRPHASLAYYVSSNESTEVAGAAALIKSLDSSRGYQMQSECCGVHDGSPYKYENPMQYFENTASRRGSRVDGFNPEYGTPCLPTVESLREMMPAKDLWPINDSVWNYLDGGGFHQVTTKYREAVDQFGPSSSIEEFAKKAQFVGALNYRAIWEVWNRNKFGWGDRFASGFLFWYHNSPVRQTGGRMYDWSLEPTAALYYSQNGLQPLHAQFDYLKNTVSVYNDYRSKFDGYTVYAELYDIHSERKTIQQAIINIPADGVVKDAITLVFPQDISPVHFIKLILKDEKDNVVSDAFYWRSTNEYKGAWTMTGPATAGFQSINELPQTMLNVKATMQVNGKIDVTVTNTGKSLAFFTQLKLQDGNGKSIRPAFYSDNFINLLPGESKKITISFDKEDAGPKEFFLRTEAFNAKAPVLDFKVK
ncbi:glycoside hydrolase family 2 protein [uncultured Chitinophaga sp.]|uniref:glycoside hydrolase family 2 protein n=1 Tax=uncultured Chitinophaga sp. TaxID=339340 RepID=UPI0025E343D0|nr:glycoside hydrolase family 2 protein [uncultured Chitinophaga sp.]